MLRCGEQGGGATLHWVVCLLSDARADKDIAMQGGATLLFIAAHSGHLEVVRLLSDAGADKDIAMQGGATRLLVASHSGHLEVVRLLFDAAWRRQGHRNAGWCHPLVHRIPE